MNRTLRIGSVWLAGGVLGLVLACHLTQPETQEAFTFPGLSDSLSKYDSALILLKNPNGTVIDTLFHGPVTAQVTLKDLVAKDYHGGDAIISIEGYKDGKAIYQIEKTYDGAKDSVESTRPLVVPDAFVKIDTDQVSLVEGDSIPFPHVTVSPSDLKNSDVQWTIDNKSVIAITTSRLKGLHPGNAKARVVLVSDTSKWDTLTLTVLAKPPVKKSLDSLRLHPRNVVVAVRGPLLKIKTDVFPDTANAVFVYASLDTSIATITAEGWIKGIKAGSTQVVVNGIADPTISDTASVEVVPPVPVTRVAFALDSLDLLAGGVSVSFSAIVSPAMANPLVEYVVSDSSTAVLDSGKVRGLKLGRTHLIAYSLEDHSKADTLLLIVLSGVPERPVVSGSDLPVNTLTPTWTWHGGGQGDGHFRYRLDSEDMTGATETLDTFYTPLTKLTEEVHTLLVQERNDSGKWSPSGRHSIRIDTTRPAPPKVSVNPASPTNNPRPTWTWQGGTGDAYRYYRFKLDNGDFTNGVRDTIGTSYSPPQNLSDTVHTLYVQERDTAGNWSVAGIAFVVIDTKKPNAPAVTVSAELTNDDTPTWTWTSGGGGAGYRYKMNDVNLDAGATEVSGTSFTPTSGLGEGVFTLYVEERDSAGNWSPSASKQVRIDLTLPTQPKMDSTPFSPVNTLKPKWSWKSGGSSDGMRVYRCKIDTTDLSGAGERTDSSFTPVAPLSEGPHILYVQERDSSGNWSAKSPRKIVVSLREFLGAAPFTTGNNPKLAINSNGVLFVAYNVDSVIYVKKFQSGNWVDAAPSIAGIASSKFQFILSPGDASYIAYHESVGSTKNIVVKKLVGNSWSEVEGDTHSASTLDQGFGISVDSQENLYLVYKDSQKGIEVLRYTSSWQVVGDTAMNAMDLGEGNPIGVTGAGTPYIMTMDFGQWQSVIWKLSGNKWAQMPSFGALVSPWLPDFRVSSQGNVYVSLYEDALSGSSSSIKMFKSGGWETIYPGGNETVIPIALSPNGSLYRLQQSLYRYTGTTWITVGTSLSSYSGAFGLAIDFNEIPYLSVHDDGTGALSILKTSFEP